LNEFEEIVKYDILNDFKEVTSQEQFDYYIGIMEDMSESLYPSEISFECEYLWKLMLPWLEKTDPRFKEKQENKILDLFPRVYLGSSYNGNNLCWYRNVRVIMDEIGNSIIEPKLIENLEMIYSKDIIWELSVELQNPLTSVEKANFLSERYGRDPNEFEIYKVIQKQLKIDNTRS